MGSLLCAVVCVFAGTPVADVSASSTVGGKYDVTSAIDGRTNTHWAAANRPPVWLRVEFSGPQQVSRLRIRQCAQTTIYDNWRRIHVAFSDGSQLSCTLGDRWQEQTVSFARRQARWVRITIESTYKTSHYVGLAEIAFDDEGPNGSQRSGASIVPPPQADRPVERSTPAGDDAQAAALLAQISPKRFGSDAHPTLFLNAADVERAKANLRGQAWARRVGARLLAAADTWLALSDTQLRAVLPLKAALFDNQAVCPQCGGLCAVELSRPGKVLCRRCRKEWPDADHPDDGRGWRNPKTGTVTYFVGLYNSVAVDRVTDGVQDLADAYVLTADERYAHAASVLLDGLAAIYPTCDKGPVWYPGVGGRLNRPFYQTARTLIYYAAVYDQTYASPAWDQPSCASGAGSRRANYEQNLLRNGAEYCFQQVVKQPTPGLHNGNCDYLQGALAVGRVLGIACYVDYVLTSNLSITNFIENTIDRDGQYFETSLAYSRHAVDLFAHHAEMLLNYRSPRYPQGVNLYEHPKLRLNYLRAESDVDCSGHQPALGDSGPDLLVIRPDNHEGLRGRVYDRLEMVLARTADAQERRRLQQRLWQLADGDVAGCRERSPNARWLLFHADALPAAVADELRPAACASTLLAGARGMAVLRSTAQAGNQCAVLRWGPTLNHGSADELNVNLFALGREISYDQGYGWAHHRIGWAHSTVAHNVVVVDEKNQLRGADGAGGSLEHYARSPHVQVVAADDPLAYAGQGVDRYRRLLALVDTGRGSSYLLDVFDVRGGTQHDLSQHFAGRLTGHEGVSFGPVQTTGSLAGPQYEWGKLVQPSGWIKGQKQPFYWNAPPENGYGFLYDVQQSTRVGAAPRFTWTLGQREMTDPPQMIYPAQCQVETQRGVCRPLDSGACVVAASKPGAAATFTLDITTDGDHVVLARLQRSPASGIVGLAIDGRLSREAFNAYSPVSYCSDLVTLARVRLEPGRHAFRFQCLGKDAESTGYGFTLDAFAVTRPAALDNIGQPQTEAVALTVLPPPDARLLLAKVKGLGQAPVSDYLLLRRNGRALDSRFVSLVEPFVGPEATLTAARLAALDAAHAGCAATTVTGPDGRVDYFFDCPTSDPPVVAYRDGSIPIRFQGRFAAVLTRGGKPIEVLLCGVRRLEFGDLQVAVDRPAYSGTVKSVDYARGVVTVDVPLVEPAVGAVAYFARNTYSRNTPYELARVERSADGGTRLDLGRAALVLARGCAAADVSPEGLLKNDVPLDRERAFGRKSRTRWFDGKAIRNLRTGELGQIQHANLDGSVLLARNPGLRKGDGFELLDVQPGDRVTIPGVTKLWQSVDGQWHIRSNVRVSTQLPDGVTPSSAANGQRIAPFSSGTCASRFIPHISGRVP